MQIPITGDEKQAKRPIFKVIQAQSKVAPSRVTWGRVQDDVLRDLVQEHAGKNWKAISEKMRTKYPDLPINGKKCRERWITSIKAGVNRLPLSEAEDVLLVIYHHTYSNRWALIAKKMHARNSSCLKNNFYSLLKKVARQVLLHSQGQALVDVSATQFYGSIYVCTMLTDLLDIKEEGEMKAGTNKTPPHITEFVHTLQVTAAMCKTYLMDLNLGFLRSGPGLVKTVRDLLQGADFLALGQLFRDSAWLVPDFLATMPAEQAVSAAFTRVASHRALRQAQPAPPFRTAPTPATAPAPANTISHPQMANSYPFALPYPCPPTYMLTPATMFNHGLMPPCFRPQYPIFAMPPACTFPWPVNP
jgi:hypothetical protein